MKNKGYKLTKVRKALIDFKYEDMGYPEYFESGNCTWDFPEEGFCALTEKDMEKLVNEGVLSYFMIEDRFVPATILCNDTQEWLV